MRRRLRIGLVLWLLVVWLGLWEDVRPAAVLGGLAVAVLLVLVFPSRAPRTDTGRFRPLAALGLLAYFLWKLVQSNLVVAWEVLTPGEGINEGVVAVPIVSASDAVITVLANAISLTPGTLTLDIDRGPTTVLYVHVLHLRSIEEVRRDVLVLERYVLRAIGTPEGVAAVDRVLAEGVA